MWSKIVEPLFNQTQIVILSTSWSFIPGVLVKFLGRFTGLRPSVSSHWQPTTTIPWQIWKRDHRTTVHWTLRRLDYAHSAWQRFFCNTFISTFGIFYFLCSSCFAPLQTNHIFAKFIYSWFWAVYHTLPSGTGLAPLAGWVRSYCPVQNWRHYILNMILPFQSNTSLNYILLQPFWGEAWKPLQLLIYWMHIYCPCSRWFVPSHFLFTFQPATVALFQPSRTRSRIILQIWIILCSYC